MILLVAGHHFRRVQVFDGDDHGRNARHLVPLLALAAVISTRFATDPGTGGRLQPRLLLIIMTVGVFDVAANLLFAMATVSGGLAVVAVLGSLYPAVTVLLARIVDHERLSRVQQVGVVAAVLGVGLIAAGS